MLPPPRKVLASPEMLPRVTRRASFSSGFRPSSAPDAPPFNRRDPSGAPNGWTLRTPKRSTTLLPSRLGASVPAGPRGARALGGFPPPPDPGRAPPRPPPPTCTPRAVIPRRGSAARSSLVPSGLPSAALPGPRLPTLDLFPGAGRAGGGAGGTAVPGRLVGPGPSPRAAARFVLSQRGRRRSPRGGGGQDPARRGGSGPGGGLTRPTCRPGVAPRSQGTAVPAAPIPRGPGAEEPGPPERPGGGGGVQAAGARPGSAAPPPWAVVILGSCFRL